MKQYLNKSGQSNVYSYEIGTDYILVTFYGRGFQNYLYTYASTGVDNVEKMKQLAEAGIGLNSFISKIIKHNYERK